jgi:asparagine synthase (glutamine-hydrolysing)
MPGIAGIISRQAAAKSESTVKTLVAAMRHESFYATGTFSIADMGIHAGWVAHEGSAAARQVFQNASKDVALIFSGECFIEAAAKAQLKQSGRGFANDGECLVQLYETQGEKFLAGRNGLFSGLLIDQRQKKAFLFNDRYGMERIYWHETQDAFYFASEAKALLRVLPGLRAFDPQGISEYLALGCTLDWKSMFRGIQMLPGGSNWMFENGACRRGVYFSPAQWESQPMISAEEFEARYQEIFKRIIPDYFASESPIGLALTGGFDTRMILAARPEIKSKPVSYTFTGPTGATLDDKIAKKVAAACGMEHTLLRLQPDFFSNFGTHADKTVFITDGCYGMFGAHEIYMHTMARKLATLRLTGNYGSEVFRGMSTFKPLGLPSGIFNQETAAGVGVAAAKLAEQRKHPDTFTVFKEIPWNLFGNLAAGRSQISFRTPYLHNEIVALAYQAPGHVKRSSLPAMRFVKACDPALAKIPTDLGYSGNGTGPVVMARRAYSKLTFKLDYYSTAGLPRKLGVLNPIFKPVVGALGIAGMHKFLRYSTWFRNELSGHVKDVIATQQKSGAFWDREFLGQLVAQHMSGQKDYSSAINIIMNVDAMERKLFRDLPQY